MKISEIYQPAGTPQQPSSNIPSRSTAGPIPSTTTKGAYSSKSTYGTTDTPEEGLTNTYYYVLQTIQNFSPQEAIELLRRLV